MGKFTKVRDAKGGVHQFATADIAGGDAFSNPYNSNMQFNFKVKINDETTINGDLIVNGSDVTFNSDWTFNGNGVINGNVTGIGILSFGPGIASINAGSGSANPNGGSVALPAGSIYMEHLSATDGRAYVCVDDTGQWLGVLTGDYGSATTLGTVIGRLRVRKNENDTDTFGWVPIYDDIT